MKTGLIYQPCGLGDILFLQKLAYNIKNLGYDVYWPVVSEFKWLNDYIKDFTFVSWDDDSNHLTGPPLPDSVRFPRREEYWPGNPTSVTDDLFFFNGFGNYSPIMAGKYNSIGMEWGDWRYYVHFERNGEKEDKLFYDVLNLTDEDNYVLVNRNYRTRPNRAICEKISNNPADYNLKVVELSIVDGFSMFDWCKVFENAQEINMVETSVCYMLESPQMFDTIKQKKLTLHSSHGSFSEVDYLFSLPWSYQR